MKLTSLKEKLESIKLGLWSGSMILTGSAIKYNQELGGLKITPFNEDQVNPNSYDLRLGPKLITYDKQLDYVNYLDPKETLKTTEIIIPEEGYILEPGKLYLGETVEYTESDLYAPMLEGKSSIGRLGVSVHITAGVGDVGFRGKWTLEISAIHPVKIYPNMRVCQIIYYKMLGKIVKYSGKYQNQGGVEKSLSFKDQMLGKF